MKQLMKHPGIAQKSNQPCVSHYDVVTKGTYSTISDKISHTQFFKKFLDPLVQEVRSLDTIDFISGSSTKLLAYSSIEVCRPLADGELTSSVDSRPHMDRTKRNCGDKIAYRDKIVQQFRILFYLSDSVDSIRPFVTHALPEFGESEPQKHELSPVHVVLWTDLHNSSYIHYCTPSTTHVGGFRLCVPLDFTLDTSKTSILHLTNIVASFSRTFE
jgi:hypothetical protein